MKDLHPVHLRRIDPSQVVLVTDPAVPVSSPELTRHLREVRRPREREQPEAHHAEKRVRDADPERVRRKREVGLYKVLEEEGAPPLKVANDDG